MIIELLEDEEDLVEPEPVEDPHTPPLEEDDSEQTVELDEDDAEFVNNMVLRIMVFMEDFCVVKLFPYQREVAYRVIQSILINDGEEISVLQARQSGKSEVLANVIATCMVLLPRLAKAYPDLLGKFANGFLVGCFAPTDEQAETVWGRVVDRLSSEHAKELLADPEIDDESKKSGTKAKAVRLKKSGSLCRMQTCNPRAKIESKTYHFILVDEAQDADDYTVKKSIHPMLAFNNGSIVKTGTPNRTKGDFYKACSHNKRRQTRKGARQNHFEYNYKFVCKYNPNYKKFIAKERDRIGEDSDEFQMSYNCKWMLEQGMFTSEDALNNMGDISMKMVDYWFRTPVVVGIDPARTKDSTVVTVVHVDWDKPDAFGYFQHTILNWLEINNKAWEQQYYEIYHFLQRYNILRIGVDTTGMGSAVHDRIKTLFPNVDVIECPSDSKTQSARWKHLKAIMERDALVFPAHSKVRRLRSYRRFVQQMSDLELKFQGPYMLAEAPNENEAHDDYPDSLAIACSMTVDDIVQDVEVIDSPFFNRRR